LLRWAEGLTKAALKRGMNKLLKANRIHIETVGPPSKQRKTLAPGPDPAKIETTARGYRALKRAPLVTVTLPLDRQQDR
jgi:hypothetical protein